MTDPFFPLCRACVGACVPSMVVLAALPPDTGTRVETPSGHVPARRASVAGQGESGAGAQARRHLRPWRDCVGTGVRSSHARGSQGPFPASATAEGCRAAFSTSARHQLHGAPSLRERERVRGFFPYYAFISIIIHKKISVVAQSRPQTGLAPWRPPAAETPGSARERCGLAE